MPRREWFKIANVATGGAVIIAPAAPRDGADPKQRIHWGALLAIRNEVWRLKGTDELAIKNYILMCEDYCKMWNVTDDEIDGKG
jgi:hypothetical protein